MKTSFKSKTMRKIFEDHEKARKKLVLARTKSVRYRLADIQTASFVSEPTEGTHIPGEVIEGAGSPSI